MIWGETPRFDEVAGSFVNLADMALSGRAGEGEERDLGLGSIGVSARRHGSFGRR